MLWWLRFLLALVLGPLVWWLVTGYVATQQGATASQWLDDTLKVLPGVYLTFTLPAALLCCVLLGIDRVLKLVALDLFTVLVSPLAAYGLAWAAVHFVPEPHVQAAGTSLPLFAVYGLVWGLTIREPSRRSDQRRDEDPVLQRAAAGRPDESLIAH